MPLAEQIPILIQLTADPDRQVASEADKTLDRLPDEQLIPLLKDPACPADILSFFCFALGRSPSVLESVCMNNSTPDTVLSELAIVAELPILQALLFNQVRLIRFPAILNNMLHNSNADTSIRRRILEIEQEFFQKPVVTSVSRPSSNETMESRTEMDEPGTALASAWILPEETPPPQAEMEESPEVVEPRDARGMGLQGPEEEALFQRISKMNTSEKIKRALLGSREERSLLIRDTNRMVSTMALRSPKISEQEVDAIAAMRNISEEILRLIAANRLWMKNYSTVSNLAKNPKTPITVSIHLLPRLMEKEIRFLAKDRSVPDTVRKGAQRILQMKGSSH